MTRDGGRTARVGRDAEPERARAAIALGMQSERTLLAWVRTSLLCLVLFLTTGALGDTTNGRLLAAVAGAAAGALAAAASIARMVILLRHPRSPAPRWCPAVLAGSVAGADAIALTLLLS